MTSSISETHLLPWPHSQIAKLIHIHKILTQKFQESDVIYERTNFLEQIIETAYDLSSNIPERTRYGLERKIAKKWIFLFSQTLLRCGWR